jgi:2-polyprenyl-6-methoxyphenol hydroxylase-like FAD-dependent oxidoreductase
VYEIRSEPSTLGGAVGIPSSGVRLLDRLGVFEELSKRAGATMKMALHSSRGAELGELDLAAWSEAKTGYGYLRVKRSDLQDVLLAKAAEEGIQVQYGMRIVSIEASDKQGEIVTFSDGTIDTADLLLGCDVIHSAV